MDIKRDQICLAVAVSGQFGDRTAAICDLAGVADGYPRTGGRLTSGPIKP
jgi:hypothetical protein